MASTTDGLDTNRWGYIVTGSETVILAMGDGRWAMGAGRKAAQVIHEYVMSLESWRHVVETCLRLQLIL